MALEGFVRVVRARGIEPAGRGPPCERTLIGLDPRQRPALGPGHSDRRCSSIDLRQQRLHRLFHLDERLFACGSSDADEIQARLDVAGCQHGTKTSTKSISMHGGTDGATDGERHLGGHQIGIEDERTPQRIGPDPNPVPPEADEGVAFADPVDQAERRARPLARRDFSTARPARVLMRARNPCLRARRRLLG